MVQREVYAREARRLGLERDPEVRAQLEEATQLILMRALIKREVIGRALPDDAAVRAYYAEHQAEFRTAERVEVDQVQVSTDAVAKAIREAVARGQSFEDAAGAQGSEPVQRAAFSRGMRDPEVDTAVFGLKPGTVSAPVRTRDGIYVFRMRAHHPAGVQPLDAVRPAIEARLMAQNQERLSRSLKDRLWSKHRVHVREDLLKAAMPEAQGRATTPNAQESARAGGN
jgi:peptidyl-prolyl cis-trans isomerase C